MSHLVLAKSWSLPVLEKIINPTSASQRIDNSFAFLSNPFLLFEKVTCLLVELSIRRITIFPLPIFLSFYKSNLLKLGFSPFQFKYQQLPNQSSTLYANFKEDYRFDHVHTTSNRSSNI